MYLEVKFVRDGIEPTLKGNADQRYTLRWQDGVNGVSYWTYHGVRLDLGLFPFWEFIQIHL